MDWTTVLWPAVIGACVTLALINLRVAFADRLSPANLFFACAALAVAGMSWIELALMQTKELDQYQDLLRWTSVPIFVGVVSVAAFVRTYFDAGRNWLGIAGVAICAATQFANVLSPLPCVRRAVALQQVEGFGGVHFTVATIVNGPWNLVGIAGILTVVAFVFDASRTLWRRGNRRRAAIVGGGVVFFFLTARGYTTLVDKGVMQTPYLISFPFVGVLMAMGVELADDMLHAARLSHELRESERRMDLAAHAAALGCWAWDVERDDFWANEAARALFGFSKSERLSLARYMEAVHQEDRGSAWAAAEAVLNEGGEYARDFRVQLPDGETRWIAARGRMDAGRQLMRGVVMNITAHRDSEFALQSAREQLAHAGRVSLMGQLASALAHELNQPLGAILRNAEAAEIYLQSEAPDLEELRAIIDDIRRDDQRAGEVIDRLRSMLKHRNLDKRLVAPGELLAEAVALARTDAVSRRIALDICAAPGLPYILGDRVHLQQVLLNLLVNAMDAMSDQTARPRTVQLGAVETGRGIVEISVRDGGHGIAPEKLGHVFDPFFTTKPHGMGMGLAISSTIVAAHGGRLTAHPNDDGRGMTFRFTLPRAKEGATA